MALPPLKDGAVPSQSTANTLLWPHRPSMGAPSVAGEGHPTGNKSRKELCLPRPAAASSKSTSPTHTLVSEHQKKPVNTFHEGIAPSCTPSTHQEELPCRNCSLLLSSNIPSTHHRGQQHSGLLQSKGILPLPPPAHSHGAHPRSCQRGTRNANSIPGSPNPIIYGCPQPCCSGLF